MNIRSQNKRHAGRISRWERRRKTGAMVVEAAARRGALLLLLVAAAFLPASRAQAQAASQGQAVRNLPGFLANSIPRNDDGSTSGQIPLGFNVNFFGENFSAAWVNNNGNITFGGPLSTFTPEGLRASPLRIIAPFWADVDTRADGSALVTYGRDVVNGRPAFGVNWVNVGYFSTHADKLNSFQLVLIDRSDLGAGNFDIEFNYDRILWETGDASGGSNGFGGTPASAGYSNGTGKPEGSFEILGSRQRGLFLDSSRFGLVKRTLNSSVRGRLVFFVRAGSVDCTFSVLSIDEPFPWQGGTGTVQVAAPGDCAWTVVNNSTFITINGETSRRGSSDVEYVVPENRRAARAGTLVIAGETIRVLQDGFITLSVTPPAISVTAVDGRIPSQVAMRVEAVRDPVNWVARVDVIDGSSNWRLSLSPNSGSSSVEEPTTMLLNVSPGFGPLVAGLAEITVTDIQFGLSLKIPVVLGASQLGPRLQVSQSSLVFNAVQGSAAPPPQTLLVLNSGSGTLNWSMAGDALAAAPWLSLSPTSGTAAASALIPTATAVTVNPAGLAPGLYQASLALNAPEALNNPQTVTVSLNVAPTGTASSAQIAPTGMVFIAQQAQFPPRPQTLSISNRGSGPLSFELQPATESGVNWLVLSQTTGAAGAAPAQIQVAADISRVSPGLHRGSITAIFSTGELQIVEVILAVGTGSRQILPGPSNCTRQGFSMVSSTVGTGSTPQAGFAQPLLARLFDTCGNPVNDATVFVDIGDDTTLVLQPLGNGNYGGTWTPLAETPAVTLRFSAVLGASGVVERTFTTAVSLPLEAPVPIIENGGVVEAAGYATGWPLAPGSIISVFGRGFSTGEFFASTIPLPRQLGNVSLRIGDEDVPLFYVGPTQINALVPLTARPGDSVSLRVISASRVSAPQTHMIFPVRPGVLQADGVAVALDANSARITPQNPGRPGGVLQIYALGMGLTEPSPATGTAAPPMSVVENPVTVTIGGMEVPVSYQGLVPGLVGLYQINVLLPNSVPTGFEVPVVIEQAGITSDSSSAVVIPIVRP